MCVGGGDRFEGFVAGDGGGAQRAFLYHENSFREYFAAEHGPVNTYISLAVRNAHLGRTRATMEVYLFRRKWFLNDGTP